MLHDTGHGLSGQNAEVDDRPGFRGQNVLLDPDWKIVAAVVVRMTASEAGKPDSAIMRGQPKSHRLAMKSLLKNVSPD